MNRTSLNLLPDALIPSDRALRLKRTMLSKYMAMAQTACGLSPSVSAQDRKSSATSRIIESDEETPPEFFMESYWDEYWKSEYDKVYNLTDWDFQFRKCGETQAQCLEDCGLFSALAGLACGFVASHSGIYGGVVGVVCGGGVILNHVRCTQECARPPRCPP